MRTNFSWFHAQVKGSSQISSLKRACNTFLCLTVNYKPHSKISDTVVVRSPIDQDPLELANAQGSDDKHGAESVVFLMHPEKLRHRQFRG